MEDTEDVIVSYALGPQRCATCDSEADLKLCSGCKVVSYCSAKCQAADRPLHKNICRAIKMSRENFESEEARLRALPANIVPADIFNTCAGQFWNIPETRNYMRGAFLMVDALLKVDTVAAVEKALVHCTELMRLNRHDDTGLRNTVPVLLLRLGREQECYDFLKWWATTVAKRDYDWTDMALPYLDIHGADVLEDMGPFLQTSALGHLVALNILKIRLRLDLYCFENPDGDISDPDHVFAKDERSPGPLARDLMRRPNFNLRQETKKLENQLHRLRERVHEVNQHFWLCLVDEGFPEVRPYRFTRGSKDEARFILHQYRRAWEESQGAIEMVGGDSRRMP